MIDKLGHNISRIICLVMIVVVYDTTYAQLDVTPKLPFDTANSNFYIDSLYVPSNTPAPAIQTKKDTTNAAASSVVKKRHSPKRAAWLSAVAPGAGQIYNRKFWKLPIVYGGLAGLSFWVGRNAKDLRGYREAYKLELDDDPTTIGSYKGITGASALSLKRNNTKRSLDLSIIILAAFYSLQIVDATVDAHLFEYDINDDVSVAFKPDVSTFQALHTTQMAPGFTFSFQFKNRY